MPMLMTFILELYWKYCTLIPYNISKLNALVYNILHRKVL
jgi:hypothetical protein